MYQWTNPSTGRVQLSGTPPGWYRAVEPGPRVFVFENGELVDDTAQVVSESERLALRAEAFGENVPEQHAVAEEEADLRAALEKAADQGIDVDAVTADFVQTQRDADVTETGDTGEKADALRALILDWDQRQLEEARTLLQQLPPVAPPPLPADTSTE